MIILLQCRSAIFSSAHDLGLGEVPPPLAPAPARHTGTTCTKAGLKFSSGADTNCARTERRRVFKACLAVGPGEVKLLIRLGNEGDQRLDRPPHHRSPDEAVHKVIDRRFLETAAAKVRSRSDTLV